jgi:DNA modification methylase
MKDVTDIVDPSDAQVLADLATMSYEDVAKRHRCSRGTVYRIALKHGARKTEERIQERSRDRDARRLETLKAVLEQTATANVLDYLEGIPDDAAQMILTSVPYNLGVGYGGGASADAMRYGYYIGWLMQIICEASRVIRDGGTLFLQLGSTRDETGTLTPLDVLLFDHIKRCGLRFQSRVIWQIPHGLTPKRRLAERHETALIFSKGEPRVFNPTPGRQPQKQPGKRAFKGPRKGQISSNYLGAHPTNVWAIGNVGHNHPEKTGHPAQFPLELARRAMQIYSMPGDLVIDPFSGSGTTHVAAIQTGRSFSGCDLFYEDLRRERLKTAFPDLVSHLPGVTAETLAVWKAEARRVDLTAIHPDAGHPQMALI